MVMVGVGVEGGRCEAVVTVVEADGPLYDCSVAAVTNQMWTPY